MKEKASLIHKTLYHLLPQEEASNARINRARNQLHYGQVDDKSNAIRAPVE
jgi:hypothetical protein